MGGAGGAGGLGCAAATDGAGVDDGSVIAGAAGCGSLGTSWTFGCGAVDGRGFSGGFGLATGFGSARFFSGGAAGATGSGAGDVFATEAGGGRSWTAIGSGSAGLSSWDENPMIAAAMAAACNNAVAASAARGDADFILSCISTGLFQITVVSAQAGTYRPVDTTIYVDMLASTRYGAQLMRRNRVWRIKLIQHENPYRRDLCEKRAAWPSYGFPPARE